MSHHFGPEQPLADEQVDDLLDDLEMRCRTGAATAREMTAVRRKLAVTIRPGDAIARRTFAVEGMTVELRRQGLSCMTAEPVMVGSVFHLAFARDDLDVAPLLAVCDRCWMLGESSFECRFQFAQEIDVPAPDASVPGD